MVVSSNSVIATAFVINVCIISSFVAGSNLFLSDKSSDNTRTVIIFSIIDVTDITTSSMTTIALIFSIAYIILSDKS